MHKVCCLILAETEHKVRPDVRHPLVSHGSVSAVEQPLNPSLRPCKSTLKSIKDKTGASASAAQEGVQMTMTCTFFFF